MQANNFAIPADGEVISCTGITVANPRGLAFLMHGAGTGRKDRYLGLLGDLASEGLAGVAFDFSGHGGSSGRIEELSLERRRRQAESVLAVANPVQRLPVLAIGFSMSGQTVCDLISRKVNNIRAALLGCPAVYSEEARHLAFGLSGFTAVLRRENSWRESTAFAALRDFTGPVMVVRPPVDTVIPLAVTEQILRSCPPVAEDVVLDGATHEIYQWLDERPGQRRALVKRVAQLLS